ncbi:hypothetical protein [Nocardia sp. NPDC004260]
MVTPIIVPLSSIAATVAPHSPRILAWSRFAAVAVAPCHRRRPWRNSRADLRYWRADVLVLSIEPAPQALLQTVAALLDLPAHRVDDVWVWDVRSVR